MRTPRPRVVIAGGGVAAVEALLALRQLAGRHVSIDLIAPEGEFVHRPSSVAVPFGFGAREPLDLRAVAAEMGAEIRRAALAAVDPHLRLARLDGGEEVPYDRLIVAVGARPRPVLRGAVRFAGPQDITALESVLAAIERGEARRLAFVVSSSNVWTLPAYELAVMAAVDLRSRGVRDARVTVVTPEREPLWLFGRVAGTAVRELLGERLIALRTAAAVREVHDDTLELKTGEHVAADAVVALPELEGPRIHGLPMDERGFLPVDLHGRVVNTPAVFAAGDATAFPVKQGGLATQQADAVAAAIAVDLGFRHYAAPFRPVLRGLLMTGGAPLYLRAELGAQGEVQARSDAIGDAAPMDGEAAFRALWWPPGKVAGRYLAPYLATARPADLGLEPMEDRTATATSPSPEREDALALALLMADEDARAGDFSQAVHALDAALALGGGALPAAYAARRWEWRREMAAI